MGGWAAHDPEGYQRVLLTGILRAAGRAAQRTDLSAEELLAVLFESSAPDAARAFDALLDWAYDEIGECEREYLGRG